MTTHTSHLSNAARLERRIAAASAVAAPTDANGQTIGKPATYTYDQDGRMVSATAAAPDDAA
ncbi:hypothetical protein [Pengzhenrongella frigida]|uniref:RHS repeat protein n=1 Tax=Pengzhenrongella frigida TaxID=1259133 RepID=A0A4Q5MY72_9MICO|nr:hypothetical protein [Cellulomonas sp. HLT2-17]RYV50638.1 hypothetical protein EUA98_12330 [Cellulomonas sp. HLT2-17]